MIKFGQYWENLKFKGSVGEVNCLKREKSPDPPGLEPGTLLVMSNALTTGSSPGGSGDFSHFRQFTSPADPKNLKFSQFFQICITSGRVQKLTAVGPLGEGEKPKCHQYVWHVL